MQLTQTDIAQLQELEECLWRSDTRFNHEFMDQTLAPDFFEFGRSGRTYRRKDTLSAPAQTIHAVLPLRDFAVQLVEANVALVTYRSEVTYGDVVEHGRRSSIWSKSTKGWQLRFHQGTPI
ncbi:MAG: nuclear transport factor 2 family protein, partial [Cyanobacteria bacterium P01_A01_bin.17]